VNQRDSDPHASSRRYVVAHVGDIAPGERRIVRVRGRSYGVFNVGGEFHALLNRCPHQGGELCKGPLQIFVEADAPGRARFDGSKAFIQCPWHGWEFDIRTGQSYADPARMRVRCYPVDVRPANGPPGTDTKTRAEVEPTVAGGVHGTVVSARTAGPFKAETVPVLVDAEHVMLLLPR
jgi:3-phenylpropionate/trans-cinnamate dioxygenase ferredoxin subunit